MGKGMEEDRREEAMSDGTKGEPCRTQAGRTVSVGLLLEPSLLLIP